VSMVDVAPRAVGRPIPIHLGFRVNHLLQISVQFLVFLYWALYWPPAQVYLLQLAVLTVFAFVVDCVVSMLRYGNWRAGFGPIPVVLSSSLFVWFVGDDTYMAFVMVGLGVASKHLIQRGGRHIFNPSAFGVSMVAIPCLLFPRWFGAVDISHQLNTPPNMVEVIFLLALFVHWQVPVILITIGAALSSLVMLLVIPLVFHAHPYSPSVSWAPIYLGISLLVTDPATTPKRPMAQFLFGFAYMIGFAVIGSLLNFDHMNYWSKMLPIPIINVLAPSFDRFVAARPTLSVSWLEQGFNRWHVLAWGVLVFAVLCLVPTKPNYFDPQVSRAARFTQFDSTGSVTCLTNPVFCRPFSFGREVYMWLR